MDSSTSPIPVLCSFGAFVNSTSPSSYVSNKHIRKTLIASSIIRQSALVNKAKATGFCVNGTANLWKFRSVDQRKHFLSVNIRSVIRTVLHQSSKTVSARGSKTHSTNRKREAQKFGVFYMFSIFGRLSKGNLIVSLDLNEGPGCHRSV